MFIIGWFMVLIATFNNSSVILWWSGEETQYPKKTTDLSYVAEKLYHIMLDRVHIAMNVVIGTACISSCKSNYHAITTTTAPLM